MRHPLRTAAAARDIIANYYKIVALGDRYRRLYRADARYDLKAVSDGFEARCANSSDDKDILERVCTAYNKAIQLSRSVSGTYSASPWWQQVRDSALGPVLCALKNHDIETLGRMYRNFFRDSCSTGLTGVPFGMSNAYFTGRIKDIHRRFYLGEALCSIDYWKKQTNGRFCLSELERPDIGNPFGVVVDGILVRAGAAFQHYSAQRVARCLGSAAATVVEIGGGYGGMAYYLLRDRLKTTYIGFDVPESLALTSYYLMKSLPYLRVLLYGEGEFTADTLARYDVALMPLFTMKDLPCGSVDVVFSSHAMSDISQQAMNTYLGDIARMTRGTFLYIGNTRGLKSIRDSTLDGKHFFQLKETRPSDWNTHRLSVSDEVECLFEPVAALSTTLCAIHGN
ncbi:MAG: putative sugar O-methyltransferase [Terracidiphilus sp.]